MWLQEPGSDHLVPLLKGLAQENKPLWRGLDRGALSLNILAIINNIPIAWVIDHQLVVLNKCFTNSRQLSPEIPYINLKLSVDNL
jgi:hypothetical protein